MRKEDQERILIEVQNRVATGRIQAADAGGMPVDEVLAESIYHERRRLKDDASSAASKDENAFWDGLLRRLNRAGERELALLLRRVVQRYAAEVCGNFNPRVYAAATRLLPPALGLLLNASSPKRLLSNWRDLPKVERALLLQGETEHLVRLSQCGTVILAPTHVSNLDSILLGFAIYKLGLPPFIYGAGLNLFTNPLVGFFMHNLGAYTVDRRKTDPLYKDVLKAYATLTLEYGYHNLFFPGGTRSRAGAIERRLKLGLLGTGVHAYVNNLRAGKPKPNIYVVPATLSYQLALEAETLIDDFLKDVGKSRYIITDDEFARPRRVYEFVSQLFALDSKIYFTVGRPMDPFGNPVDENGVSLDPRGRAIDPSRYVLHEGIPCAVPQRDSEYTRELGERIVEAFGRDNVVQSTHVTARAVFTLMRQCNPRVDLMRLLRVGGKQDSVDLRDVYWEMRRLLQGLKALEQHQAIRLSPPVAAGSAEDIVADGLRHFAIYHRGAAAYRRGDRIFAGDRSLLFYYQNRLEGYGLEQAYGVAPALAPDHRSLGVAA